MNQIDGYLQNIQEGKVWDKVKKVWRDHKGKIIAGAGILAAGAAAYGGKKVYDKKAFEKRKGAESDAMKASVDAGQKIEDHRKFVKRKSAESDAMKSSVDAGNRTDKINKFKKSVKTGLNNVFSKTSDAVATAKKQISDKYKKYENDKFNKKYPIKSTQPKSVPQDPKDTTHSNKLQNNKDALARTMKYRRKERR